MKTLVKQHSGIRMKTRKPPFSFILLDSPTGLGLRQPSGAFGDAMRDAKAAEGCRSPRRYRVAAFFCMIITLIQAALT
ncbi:MAG TPA: hypothetical protein VFR76_06875, partial [Verrucomicrobiae bacterium]|nr:hypothetical protein [Verrucomicrobiae bacterium]